jgi:hypothetical protein
MRVCTALVATGLLIAGPAYADPHKASPPPTQPPKPTSVVLASAETPRGVSSDAPSSAQTPVKHRIGRLTECRCGDPRPDSEKPDR